MISVPDKLNLNSRRSPRRSAKIGVLLIVETEGHRVESPANALDMSQHGLRAQSTIPLAPGQVVGIAPFEGVDYAVRSRVVWVGPVGSERAGEAGLEFLRPLPATV